jgi:hypothetical protein
MENVANHSEARQAYEDKKSEQINKVASIILTERQGELTPNNLNTLFVVTAGSLLEHGFVSKGQIYQEGETGYQTSDLSISALEAQDRMLQKLGIDEMGDWAIKFDTQPELVDYLSQLSAEFEQELIQVLEDKELING